MKTTKQVRVNFHIQKEELILLLLKDHEDKSLQKMALQSSNWTIDKKDDELFLTLELADAKEKIPPLEKKPKKKYTKKAPVKQKPLKVQKPRTKPDKEAAAQRHKDVLDFIASKNRIVTTREVVAEFTDYDSQWVTNSLYHLMLKGRIKTVGKAKWKYNTPRDIPQDEVSPKYKAELEKRVENVNKGNVISTDEMRQRLFPKKEEPVLVESKKELTQADRDAALKRKEELEKKRASFEEDKKKEATALSKLFEKSMQNDNNDKEICTTCHGYGDVGSESCPVCGGDGYVRSS